MSILPHHLVVSIYRRVETTGQTKAADGSGSIEWVISSERRDRVGDIVRASGVMLDNFKRNPIALFNHDHNRPIGKWSNFRLGKTADGVPAILADITFASTPLAKEVESLVKDGILSAASIGFQPASSADVRTIDANGNPVDEADSFGPFMPEGFGREFLRWHLLECSVVSVPANPDAVARREFADRVKAMPEIRKALGLDGSSEPAAEPVAAPEAKACSGAHCDGCGYEASMDEEHGGAHCKGCSAKRDEKYDLSAIARALKDVSSERCAGCGRFAAFHGPTRKFLFHAREDGSLCREPKKVGERDGLSISRFLELLDDGLHDVSAAREEMFRAGRASLPLDQGLDQLATRSALVLEKLMVETKAGRVIRGELLSKIEIALAAVSAAHEALLSVRDAAKPRPESDDEEPEPEESEPEGELSLEPSAEKGAESPDASADVVADVLGALLPVIARRIKR